MGTLVLNPSRASWEMRIGETYVDGIIMKDDRIRGTARNPNANKPLHHSLRSTLVLFQTVD